MIKKIYCPWSGCGMANGAAPVVPVLCKNCKFETTNFNKICPKCKYCISCNRISKNKYNELLEDLIINCENLETCQNILEQVYDCGNDMTKRIVVITQSQIGNATLSPQLAELVRFTSKLLKTNINQSTINTLFEKIKELGLSPFRGTLHA